MSSTQELKWYWHRLRAMDVPEIVERLRRSAMRWRDASPPPLVLDLELSVPVPTEPWLPDPAVASQAIRDTVGRRAAAVREGNWLMFGWREIAVDNPPRWHRDYAKGVEVPLAGGTRPDYRALPGGADPRCVWEVNRWSELVSLAQNAWLNGVHEDVRLAQAWLLDWCSANPVGEGINWTSALEAGLRLLNFCWIDALIRGCGDASLTRTQDEIARLVLPGHAWYVWRHRSFGSSANNHLLGELAGLSMATRRWPALARMACPAEHAADVLAAEVLKQFAPDGGNREQSLHYHQFAWELGWHALRYCTDSHAEACERLREAARYTCDLGHSSDSWEFGDSDDAQVTPLTASRETAGREWRGWLLRAAEGAMVQFWLGDPPSGITSLPLGEWRSYSASGMAVQEVNGWKARVDGSALGYGSLAAHGHLDAMHFSLWDGERALLVDPGTGAYFSDPATRARLASWEWHNGPVPQAGRAHPVRTGLFMWDRAHEVPALSTRGGDCVVALQADGGLLTRCVRYDAGPDSWVITDDTPGGHMYVVRWRLAPSWKLVAQSHSRVIVTEPDETPETLTIESDGMTGIDIREDIVAPHFGSIQRGLVVSISFRGRLVSRWGRQ